MNKTLKKVAALALALCMTASMAACGSASSSSSSAAASTGSEASSTAGKKIKLVLCVGRKNDLSFQQSAYEGSQRVAEELGDKYDVSVVEMGDDTTKWLSAFYDACDGGADIVVGTGFQNKGNFETLGKEYPDTKFILFDQDVDYSTGDLSNVLSALFESSQSGYLAGVVAALYTTSDKAANTDKTIGFVGGMDSTTVNNFLVGYAEGAHSVDPEIKVLSSYVGDYIDTAKAKDLANAQISDGADIIFQVAGGAGNGVLEAAAEAKGVMAIGVDSDQYETTAGTNLQASIITSALKRLDNALFKICSDYAEGKDVGFGKVVTYGLADDAVGIVFNDNLTNSIGEANVALVKEALTKIQSGEITVSTAASLSADEIKAIVNGK